MPPISYIVWLFYVLLALFITGNTAHAETTDDHNAQTILHVLDYVSVDYGGTVLYGTILNETEFKEQLNFAEQAALLMHKLPEHPRRAELITQSAELAHSVRERMPVEIVRNLAQQLRRIIIESYSVPVTPRRLPNTLPAMALYQQMCAPCHGNDGHGDGVLSKTFTPRPANFHDAVRMGQRSIYGLYNSITLGVSRTSMPEFSQLSDDDRWSLAFLIANFRIAPDRIEQGRKLWESRNYEGPTPDLASLTTLTDNETTARYGEQTKAVYSYLRSEPKALSATPHATLIFATEQLDLALIRYSENDRAAAQQLAIAAYLEGFEPMEIGLDTLDKQLRRDIEAEMMKVRLMMSKEEPFAAVAEKVAQTKALIRQTDERLRGGRLSVKGTFISALLVLVREALEGVLVIAVLLAFLAKKEQQKALRYVHAGWISALLLGGITWLVAHWLGELSGISREIASSITAFSASAMLIYLNLWLYHKALQPTDPLIMIRAGHLKNFSLWMLGLLAFFAIFRAAFESAFFYEALWIQTITGTRSVIWSGIVSAIVLLFFLGWAFFRLGLLLSPRALLGYTSILMAVMALILVGQGVASLQKSGVITTTSLSLFSLPTLGIMATAQTLLAQLVAICMLATGYWITNKHQANHAHPTSASASQPEEEAQPPSQ
jgi:high-affinity iron transporter